LLSSFDSSQATLSHLELREHLQFEKIKRSCICPVSVISMKCLTNFFVNATSLMRRSKKIGFFCYWM